MSDDATSSRAQLERELRFYRDEYNALGARMLRIQEQLSQVSREARRSKTVARLVQKSYAISGWDLSEDAVGEAVLSVVADNSICDDAIFLERVAGSNDRFLIRHSLAKNAAPEIFLPDPPSFCFSSTTHPLPARFTPLQNLMNVPFVLWAFDAATGMALLLGKRIESNTHRPFDAGDREIVDVALAVYEDLRLRKRAEAMLLKAKLAAEDASEARARFLAKLSHERGVPLNAIMGFAKLFVEKAENNGPVDEALEYARLILDAGESLSALTRDILDFSTLSYHQPKLRKDWIPVHYLFYNVARTVQAQVVQNDVKLLTIPVERELEALIDYDRFRQVLLNLLSNGIKFTPRGGFVSMAAQLIEDNALLVSVCDSGIGMKEEDIPRVLEPFVQLAEFPSKGAGLGLSIATELVTAHGGTLRIESALGKGTRIVITLPADSARMNREHEK